MDGSEDHEKDNEKGLRRSQDGRWARRGATGFVEDQSRGYGIDDELVQSTLSSRCARYPKPNAERIWRTQAIKSSLRAGLIMILCLKGSESIISSYCGLNSLRELYGLGSAVQ